MDFKFLIGEKVVLEQITLSKFVQTHDSENNKFKIIYYSHGNCLAKNYNNPEYNESTMNSYLHNLAVQISSISKSELYLIDLYEQTEIPLSHFYKYKTGKYNKIKLENLQDKFNFDIFNLINKLIRKGL